MWACPESFKVGKRPGDLQQSAAVFAANPSARVASAKTIHSLVLPPVAKNVEVLRKLPKLKRLGYKFNGSTSDQTAEEFWAEYDRAKSTAP